MRLRQRIIAVATASLIGLLLFGGASIWETTALLLDAKQAEARIDRAPVISELVHELQRERGLSAGFIGAKGDAFVNRLQEQRTVTDGALKQLVVVLPKLRSDSVLSERVQEAEMRLAGLGVRRAAVSNLSASVADMAGYYSSLIGSLLQVAGASAEGLADGGIVNQSAIYNGVLQAKERAGIERAMGANGFSGGAFSSPVYLKFVELGAEQTAFMSAVRDRASASQLAFMEETLSGAVVDRVFEMRQLARASAFGADVSAVTGPEWFQASTDRIDLFKRVEDRMAADLRGAAAAAASSALTSLSIWVGLLIAALGLSRFMAHRTADSVTKPMTELVDKIQQVSAGGLDVEINESTRTDEIGDMARALLIFRDNETERLELAAAAEAEAEARAVRARAIEVKITDFQTLADGAIGDVETMAKELANVSKSLGDATGSTKDSAESASASSSEASNSVQSVAAAVEELSSSIADINSRIVATQKSTSVAADAARGATDRVRSLDASVESVGGVVTMISEIAEQTNLLALNATIEAERAGTSGRGFAVVAQEVKQLASQTADATAQITKQIADIQEATKDAVAGIGDISTRFEELETGSAAIASAVDQQSEATDEISRGVQIAADGSESAKARVTGVAASAEETAQSANAVRTASGRMSDVSDQLKMIVTDFLDTVKAA